MCDLATAAGPPPAPPDGGLGVAGSRDQLGSDDDLLASAAQFITLYHAENIEAGPPRQRLLEVQHEIETTGTYRHTPAELTFAARVAWRNSSR